MLVGPYPPCTQTSAAATGIFEGGVGNPTRSEQNTSPIARYSPSETTTNHPFLSTKLVRHSTKPTKQGRREREQSCCEKRLDLLGLIVVCIFHNSRLFFSCSRTRRRRRQGVVLSRRRRRQRRRTHRRRRTRRPRRRPQDARHTKDEEQNPSQEQAG